MKEITLREMQKIELELLLAFDKACKAAGLQYYIDGGTLLGAMCYEGFIPWDDDIDLKMPRADYDRLPLLQGLLPEHMCIEMPEKGHCDYLFTKLTDTRTVLVEYAEGTKKVSGVYIDILPMDGHPEDEAVLASHLQKLGRYNSLFHASLSGFRAMRSSASFSARVKGTLYRAIYSPWRLYQKLTKTAIQYPYEGASAVGLLIEGKPMKERFPKSWLEPPVELEFEGHTFPAPNAYREHMVVFYGEHVISPECYHNLPQYPANHHHEVYWRNEYELSDQTSQ